MAREVYYRFFSYDRNLLPYIVFSNLISLIIFIDRDIYNNDNIRPYSPLDRLFFIIY